MKCRNTAFLGLLSIALWWTVVIVVRFASSPAADGSSGGGGGGGGCVTGGSDRGIWEMAHGARGGTGGNDLLPAPLAPLTPEASPLPVPSPSRALAPSHPAPPPPATTVPLPAPAPSRPPHNRSGAADAAAGAGAGAWGGGAAAAVEGGEGGKGGDRRMEKVRESRAGEEGGDGAVALSMGVGPRPLIAVYFIRQARTLNRTVCSVRRRVLGPLLAQGFTPVVFVVGARPAIYCPPLQSLRCRPSFYDSQGTS